MSSEAVKVVSSKKTKLEKGKLKKTIKHILCRPDREFWPAISEHLSIELANIITKHRVEIPEAKKLPWSVIKTIPKEQRPKYKRPLKIGGFIFGLSQCARALPKGQCAAIIIDSGVSPQIVVSHIIENALQNKTPVVCMADLKIVTALCFGFPSCVITLDKSVHVEEISKKVTEYWEVLYCEHNTIGVKCKEKTEVMELEEFKTSSAEEKPFQYLTRTSKSYRAFIPPQSNENSCIGESFSAQNFINLKTKKEDSIKSGYKGMVVKKFANNPNRKKDRICY